ncbi:centrosomal protein CEP57L1 isoform X1 [Pleurodeles waltl]|uniref:centrosomal protein CEP57L1 isoform X1 n=2 Tax=Pleurodeles waltl TaxID=8319 RepID=UPI0037095921
MVSHRRPSTLQLRSFLMDSTIKDSYLGSFYQPPNKVPSRRTSFGKIDSCNRKADVLHSSKPVSATFDVDPAPNSKELMSALQTLHEKIRRLELERTNAEDNLQSLSKEAAEYKKVLECEHHKKDLSGRIVTEQRHEEVTSELSKAQSRCSLLEKQLDYMRKLVQNAEKEKNAVVEQQASLRRENDLNQEDLRSKLERLDVLEKECVRLTGTQRTAQNKISQLQEKLHEEQHHRKLLQQKAEQLETGLEINRLLIPTPVSSKSGPKKKAKKKCSAKKTADLTEPHRQQMYPKAGELPFVAGKSLSSSHSLSANVQTVLHMIKHNSPRVSQPPPGAPGRRAFRAASAGRPISSSSTSSSTSEGLADVLLSLQEELGQMSFEHQDLLKQIQDTQNNDVREDLERELDCLTKQMETKGEQIFKLKNHQVNVKKLKLRAQKAKKSSTVSKHKAERPSGNKELLVSPRRRTAPSKGISVKESPSSLQLLKNFKKLQMTLKKEDIMWEK